uniref:Putative ribonuclease H-like domain-containing protein n=1 Tax=Tanacetum cinerariifolium TaxID=118510 RepID=A0A6L2LFW2_TANCI|nr:putative ribonuclease H-like domain-containing protein [Tanacetum cinerariifolium]
MFYLTYYEEIDGGYVTFGGNPKGGKITDDSTIKTVVTDDYSRFTWVFFLATKDDTSDILKSFITRIENLVDHKVEAIRCDNRTEIKNREMNQFCEMKGILRQFSVARTPQQNEVLKRGNMTLIKAARTMLVDSKLLTTFWAEAFSTACYVKNKVLVIKPHYKTPYELFYGRTPTLSFIRPFGCPVTILNTIDYLGKFDGKTDEGFFIGYSLNSKAFKVFNSRTRIVEENLYIRFSKSTPCCTQSNVIACTKASDNVGQARKETEPSSHDYGSKPSSDDGKKVDEDPRKESKSNDHKKEDNVNSTNHVNTGGNVNTISSTINATGTNEVNVVSGKISIEILFDPKMHALKDDSIFNFLSDYEDDGVVADMNNLDTTIQVSSIPTTRIHKDHPLDQVIKDLQSATQTRKMSKNLEEHGFEEPKKVIRALKDLSWIKAMQEELLQFKNKKDKRGIMIRNKARLVDQGYIQEERINYDEVFFSVARMEAIRLFLAYASFKDFVVYLMDEKSAFLYGQIEEEVSQDYKHLNGTQKPLLKDEYDEKVDVHMYRYQVNAKVSHLYAVKRIFRCSIKFRGGLLGIKCSKSFPLLVMKIPLLVHFPTIDDGKAVWNGIRVYAGDSKLMLIGITYYCWVKVNAVEGGGPWCQETMVATTAQTRFKSVSKHSNDSLLARGNVLQSDEDSLKLDELMALCTILQNRVLDLEKTTTTQCNEIASLKKKVKKLKKKNRSRTHRLKRLYKVGLTGRVESSGNEEILGEDVSKQGTIDAIDADEEITLVSVQDEVVSNDADKEMFVVDVLDGKEVFVAEHEVAVKRVNKEVNVVEEVVEVIAKLIIDAAQVSVVGDKVCTASATTTVSATTTTTATITTNGDITLVQALKEIKRIDRTCEAMKRKVQIKFDEESALKLQAIFDEEERLAREKAEKVKEANITLIETWDDIQAKIDVDHQLVKRMQAQE